MAEETKTGRLLGPDDEPVGNEMETGIKVSTDDGSVIMRLESMDGETGEGVGMVLAMDPEEASDLARQLSDAVASLDVGQ